MRTGIDESLGSWAERVVGLLIIGAICHSMAKGRKRRHLFFGTSEPALSAMGHYSGRLVVMVGCGLVIGALKIGGSATPCTSRS